MKKRTTLLSLLLIINNQSLADACSVSVDNLNFGNYQPFSNSDLETTTNIYLSCVRNRNNENDNLKNPNRPKNFANNWITISLSTGSSGTYTNRTLQNTGYNLYYNLYTSNRRNRIWGNGSSNTVTITKRVKTNHQTIVKIYGQIPHTQSIPPGIYSDNIFAEISY